MREKVLSTIAIRVGRRIVIPKDAFHRVLAGDPLIQRPGLPNAPLRSKR
jgi:hypothetical protein